MSMARIYSWVMSMHCGRSSYYCSLCQYSFHDLFQKIHLGAGHPNRWIQRSTFSKKLFRFISSDLLWPLFTASFTNFRLSHLFLFILKATDDWWTSKRVLALHMPLRLRLSHQIYLTSIFIYVFVPSPRMISSSFVERYSWLWCSFPFILNLDDARLLGWGS